MYLTKAERKAERRAAAKHGKQCAQFLLVNAPHPFTGQVHELDKAKAVDLARVAVRHALRAEPELAA